MQPNSNENLEYKVLRYNVEVARRFNKNALIVSGYRYTDQTNTDNSHGDFSMMYIGFYYNFNYPVP
jgi:hypothetical protein